MLFNTKNLLGMNEKIMMSRKLCEKYKPEIINIYNQVVNYIKNKNLLTFFLEKKAVSSSI